jgi:SAM-dependent methyltransferase
MGSPKTGIFQLKAAGDALEKLLNDYTFDTVLDIGCGKGQHTKILVEQGKQVTATDYHKRFKNVVEGLYHNLKFEPHDITWASHVLEHQLNVNEFLTKMRRETRLGGWCVVTVPPAKRYIVGGHVTTWNAGILMYNLVLAGFDCRHCSIKRYGYNITVIAQATAFDLPQLNFDNGDIDLLKPWLPEFCEEGFNGDIDEWNW